MRLLRTHYPHLAFVIVCGVGLFLLAVGGSSTASAPTIRLVAPEGPQPAIGTIDVAVQVVGAVDLGAWEFDLGFDPALLRVAGMTIAPTFGVEEGCNPDNQRCVVSLGPITDVANTASVGAFSYGGADGLTGDGVLATLHLRPTGASGTAVLTLKSGLLANRQASPVTPILQGTTLALRGGWRAVFLPVVRR